MIRTLVVDDEEHARDRLRHILEEYSNIEIIGVCKNGIEAIKQIEEKVPDLVFLDIEMPGVNGFDVIGNVEFEKVPIIIFITAFSEYAVKAFEVNALDYIHKPFDKDRLFKAIERVEHQIENSNEKELRDRLKLFLNVAEAEEKPLDRFVIKSGGSIYIVKTNEVLWIEASGNYVNIVTEQKKHLLRSTMSGMKNKLDKKVFYQIHRSTIVNLDYVHRIEEWSYGDYKVVMKNGEELKMSRNFKELLQSI